MKYKNNYYQIDDNFTAAEKKQNWEVSFGLQKVDDLMPSEYMQGLAEDNIEGKVNLYDIEELVHAHYDGGHGKDNEKKEADLVSTRINILLQTGGIALNSSSLKATHAFLFEDILADAGHFREYNISKKEPILFGETVKYANYFMIEKTLTFDFAEEAEIKYASLTDAETVKRLANFTSRIWQVHPFSEGNTRTTAVFMELYLNTMGFTVDNALFKDHAKYFRNTLVRANFADYRKKIDQDRKPLENFFAGLLFHKEEPFKTENLTITKLK